MAKANGDGEITRQFVHARGRVVALLDGDQAYRVYTDSRGMPTAVTNQGGTEAVWTAETTPFGVAHTDPDPDGDGEAFELNLRLPGHYYDAETGWHSNHYRTYAPRLGRYLQPDPEGLAAGANRYAYAQNRPLVRIDPDGREPEAPRRPDVMPLPANAGVGARPALPAQPTPQADVVNPTNRVAADNGGANRTVSENGSRTTRQITDVIEDLDVWRPGCANRAAAERSFERVLGVGPAEGASKANVIKPRGLRAILGNQQIADVDMAQKAVRGTTAQRSLDIWDSTEAFTNNPRAMALALAEGATREDIKEQIIERAAPAKLMNEAELDAFVDHVTGPGSDTVSEPTMVDIWPLFRRLFNGVVTDSFIDKRDGSYHEYRARAVLCRRDQAGCDEDYADQVYEYVRENDIPFQEDGSQGPHVLRMFDSPTVEQLDERWRQLCEARNVLPRDQVPANCSGPPPSERLGEFGNPIRHREDKQERTSLNITEPGHIFHPGTVRHEVHFVDGMLVYDIVGTGTGDLAGPNNVLGLELLFVPAARKAIRRFAKR